MPQKQTSLSQRPDGRHHLVIAPPGCGKTYALTRKILALLDEGCPPGEILCLTFTRTAAAEMRERLVRAGADIRNLFIGTLHAFCLRTFARSADLPVDRIINASPSLRTLTATQLGLAETAEEPSYRNLRRELTGRALTNDSVKHSPVTLARIQQLSLAERLHRLFPDLDAARSQGEKEEVRGILTPGEDYFREAGDPGYRGIETGEYLHLLIREYERIKKEMRLCDYHDILLASYRILRESPRQSHFRPFRHILIDEVQDLNDFQLALTELLVQPGEGHFYYYGDPQQTIYSFMGAGLARLSRLQQQCGPDCTEVLSENYRSNGYLIPFTNRFSRARILSRRDHIFSADRSGWIQHSCPKLSRLPAPEHAIELVWSPSSRLENRALAQLIASFPKRESTAILLRDNATAEAIARALHESGRFLVTNPRQDALRDSLETAAAHLALCANPDNEQAWPPLVAALSGCSEESIRNILSTLQEAAVSPYELLHFEDGTLFTHFHDLVHSRDYVLVERKNHQITITTFSSFTDEGAPSKQPTRKSVTLNRIDGSLAEICRNQNIIVLDTVPAWMNEGDTRDTAWEHFLRQCGRQARCVYPLNVMATRMDALLQRAFSGRRLPVNLLEDNEPEVALAHQMDSIPGIEAYQRRCLAPGGVRYLRYLLHFRYKPAFTRSCSFLEVLDETAGSKDIVDAVIWSILRLSEAGFVARKPVKTIYEKANQAPTEKTEDLLLNGLRSLLSQELRRHCDATQPDSVRQVIQHCIQTVRNSSTASLAAAFGQHLSQHPVSVMTVHQSKGLAFDNVVMARATDISYPHQDKEEDRIFYVGLSRARKRIIISYSDGPGGSIRSLKHMQSSDKQERRKDHEPKHVLYEMLQALGMEKKSISATLRNTTFMAKKAIFPEIEGELVEDKLPHDNNRPQLKGSITIEGKTYYISGWMNVYSDGTLSIAIKDRKEAELLGGS